MNGGAWWDRVHKVVKSWTQLIDLTFTLHSALKGFPGGSDSEESACKAGDLGLIPGWRRSSEDGNDNPLQYSCLENSMN